MCILCAFYYCLVEAERVTMSTKFNSLIILCIMKWNAFQNERVDHNHFCLLVNQCAIE